MPQLWIDGVALSADGNYLATAGRDSTARVWNLTTGQELIRLTHGAPVEAVAFSRDSATLSTGSFDGTARLWELPSGRERLRATHPGGSEVVTFSPDGTQVASGGSEGEVNVWSLNRSDQLAAIKHLDRVDAVSSSPGGDRMATAGARGDLRIWRSDGRVEFATDAYAHDGLAFSQDGHFLAGVSGGSLFVMNLTKDTVLTTTLATFHDASEYSLSPRYLVGEGSDHRHIRAWETAGGRELPQIEAGNLQKIKLDPTGTFIAIEQLDEYGRHGAIRVRDLSGHDDIRQIPFDGTVPREFALGPRGRVLALYFSRPIKGNTAFENYVEMLDISTGKPLARIPQEGLVYSMRFDPSGTRLVILPGDEFASKPELDVWEWATSKLRARLLHEDEISKITFSEQHPVLATVSDGRVYVWDYAIGELLSQLADAGYVRDLRFSGDGRYVLTGSADGTAALWLWKTEDLRTEACKRLMRNLSPAEWRQYLGSMPYRATCSLGTVPAR
jgi:WD40 repeat protein